MSYWQNLSNCQDDYWQKTHASVDDDRFDHPRNWSLLLRKPPENVRESFGHLSGAEN